MMGAPARAQRGEKNGIALNRGARAQRGQFLLGIDLKRGNTKDDGGPRDMGGSHTAWIFNKNTPSKKTS